MVGMPTRARARGGRGKNFGGLRCIRGALHAAARSTHTHTQRARASLGAGVPRQNPPAALLCRPALPQSATGRRARRERAVGGGKFLRHTPGRGEVWTLGGRARRAAAARRGRGSGKSRRPALETVKRRSPRAPRAAGGLQPARRSHRGARIPRSLPAHARSEKGTLSLLPSWLVGVGGLYRQICNKRRGQRAPAPGWRRRRAQRRLLTPSPGRRAAPSGARWAA